MNNTNNNTTPITTKATDPWLAGGNGQGAKLAVADIISFKEWEGPSLDPVLKGAYQRLNTLIERITDQSNYGSFAVAYLRAKTEDYSVLVRHQRGVIADLKLRVAELEEKLARCECQHDNEDK